MIDPIIKRIVIACDAVGENVASIEAAAQLAVAMNAALRGVFVQDEGLLSWAALPFARNVGEAGEAHEVADEATILRQFEAYAVRVRTAVETAARTHAIGWSFDVVRGQSTLATLSIGDQDLLVIEGSSRPFAGRFRLGSRWLAEAFQAHGSVLLVRNAREWKEGVVALLRGSGKSAERVAAVAAGVAHAGNRRLTVLVAGDEPELEAVRGWVRAVSELLASRCRIERLAFPKSLPPEAVEGGALLVVDADPSVNDAASLRGLLDATQGDILFLR